jgi:Holliday junction resolvase
MRAAKIDANQREIVDYLRAKGVSVAITSNIGDGFPDLVCGFRGKNILLELKDGDKAISQQKLTAKQIVFHSLWRGQIAVVNSPETAWKEVIRLCNEA